MFPTTFCCCLCLKTQTELITLLNQNGQHNETYEIAAKYFDPLLLTTVICLECWSHIEEFHEFQQSVLKAQENLNVVGDIKPLLKLEVVTIDEDVDNNLKEEMNMPIFDPVDINDFNQLCSDDEIPLVECFPKEMREFEVIRTIKRNENSENTTDSLASDETIRANRGNDGQCPYCPLKLSMSKNLPRHIKVLHPEEFAESEELRKKRKRQAIEAKKILKQENIKTGMGNGLFGCPHCQKKFKSKKNIPRHMKSYHPNEYAEYKIRTKPRVDIHSLLHGLEKCDSSESKNETNNDTFEETELLNSLNDDNCDSQSKNDKSNDTSEKASVQQKTHDYDAFIAKWKHELECNLCNNSFSNYHLLYTHFKHEHPDENCHIVCCENKLWSRPDIVEHIILHLNPSTFKCEICEKYCKTYIGLKKHIRNVHSDEVRDRPFECNVCQKRFHKKDKLLVHVGIHISDINHICKLCAKGFSTDLLLKKHMNNAHNKRCLCDHCGKAFKNNHDLKQHQLVHDVTKPKPQYLCSKCGSKFKSRGILDRHRRRHHNDVSTDQHIMCSECNKICPTKNALYQHKRAFHTNKIKRVIEAKYQCTICYKRFKYNQVLQDHASTHTGLQLYKCEYCPTKFKQKKNIRRHIQLFHSEFFCSNEQNVNLDEIAIQIKNI